jgi:hypothetical protein
MHRHAAVLSCALWACAQASPAPEPPAAAARAGAVTPVEASCAEGPAFTPQHRLWMGTIRTTYAVLADGSLGKIEHETYGMRAPAGAVAAIEGWLHSCRFKPARAGERAIPTRLTRLFNLVPENGAPPITTAYSDPERRCPTPGPSITERVSGTAVLSFVLGADGRVEFVELKNADAPPAIYAAARTWILSCRFVPAVEVATQRPAEVRIEQPIEVRAEEGGRTAQSR